MRKGEGVLANLHLGCDVVELVVDLHQCQYRKSSEAHGAWFIVREVSVIFHAVTNCTSLGAVCSRYLNWTAK